MNMKTTICLFLMLAMIGCGRAQDEFPTRQWSVTLKIVDETGLPVVGVQTAVSYRLPTPIGEGLRSDRVAGLTDTNGIFMATHVDRTTALGFHVEKNGYYPTFARYELGYPPKMEITNIPMQMLVLKRILHPIPMYAKLISAPPPAQNESIGYDLMAGDWVAPHGKGVGTDMIFKLQIEKREKDDSDYILAVSFPNEGDGIQSFFVPDAEKGSALLSPHEAPAGGYQSQWVQTRVRRSRQPLDSNRDRNRNYFFRVRTVLDEKGNVKSALYGKIYGDFMQFAYYLNPIPNDRNVEFDPKQNLMQNLKSFEQATRP